MLEVSEPSRRHAAAASHADHAALGAALSRTESLLRTQRDELLEVHGPRPATMSAEPAECALTGSMALVDLHADLADGLTDQQLNTVRRVLRVPIVEVQAGALEPQACARAAEAVGPLLSLLLIEGLVVCETLIAGQVSSQIFGPGDMLNGCADHAGSLTGRATLYAPAPVRVAALDDRLLAAMSHWPRVASRFFTQAMWQADRAAEHRAISQLTRVEDRLLAIFWHLADRWGHVRTDGIVVELALTHQMIGRLIGARRPTVTLGLSSLAAQGLLRRQAAGGWLLARESQSRFSDGATRPQPGPRATAA